MAKQSKTAKAKAFAATKRMIKPSDARIKKPLLNPNAKPKGMPKLRCAAVLLPTRQDEAASRRSAARGD
jgi:hypothetical protein